MTQQNDAATHSLSLAVLSDIHLSPPGTPDYTWNNVIRRSASAELLTAALRAVTDADHDRLLLLGDIADDGSEELIATVLDEVRGVGVAAWAVPGNHDVCASPDALDRAAAARDGDIPLPPAPRYPCPGVVLAGSGLVSRDGGGTCRATHLSDTAALDARLLIWASHYPLVSAQGRMQAADLRYPGDLVNLIEARAAAERFAGPILVLHGHLHAAVDRRAGRMLQIGFPALVEWPHAWASLSVQIAPDTVTVQVTLNRVPGDWSAGTASTMLSEPARTWTFSGGQWHAGRPG